MKTRFYMLNLLAGIAFVALCLSSCGKDAFLDMDDPATRGFTLDTFRPIDPIDPPILEASPIECWDSNTKMVSSPLFVGTPYTFKLRRIFDINDIPLIGFTIKNSSGEVLNRLSLGSSTTKQYTFTTPDVYTVSVTVITKKQGTKTYSSNYEVINEGFDTSNPKLNVPFDLYLNLKETDKVVLNVRETLFNDPKCAVWEEGHGHFKIRIMESGKYEFNVNYPDLGISEVGTYHANVFYRPRLVCISAPLSNGRGYTNWFQGWTSSKYEHLWFFDRMAFSCYPTGYPEQAVSYTVLQDTFSVQVFDTPRQYREDVYIREYAHLYPNPFKDGWIVVYPRDTCYYFSGVAVIK